MVEEYKEYSGLLFYWEMKITMVFRMVQKLNIPLEEIESTIRAHALYKLLIKQIVKRNK
jgi:hypothetical protein